MGRQVRSGMAILSVLSLSAAMDAAQAAHKVSAHEFPYCGEDYCHRIDVGHACWAIGKEPGQKILFNPYEKPICYCICP